MKKDPNKPRGKTSSYAYFVSKCREEHKKNHPGTSVGFAEFSKRCSERWKVRRSALLLHRLNKKHLYIFFNVFVCSQTMSAKEKVRFEDMAKTDKVRYDREMKTYTPPKGTKLGKKKKDPNAPKRPP